MISTYTLNHFGIVAGICQELQLCHTIDALIPPDPQQTVTTGQAVVAMIINGLGFSNRTLYLFPQFFENKPVDLLIAKGLTAEKLNDDAIGRTLDRLFKYGCTELFCSVASVATEITKVNRKFGHLDTTTFSVHGDYNSSAEEGAAIQITYGHSKEKRPDLKQIFLNLLVSADGGIPLFMQALNGNSSDKIVFRQTVTKFRKGLKANLHEVTYWIADSCFYTAATIKVVKTDVQWISRVPGTLKEAKAVIEKTILQFLATRAPTPSPKARTVDSVIPLLTEGYSYVQHRSTYGDVTQRWLVIHSEQAEARALHSIEHAVKKEFEKLCRLRKKLQKKEFQSEAEVEESLQEFQAKAKYHTCHRSHLSREVKYKHRGRPRKVPQTNEKHIYYHTEYTIVKNEKAVELEVLKRAIFIIATNELSHEKLRDQEVFDNYKGQKHVEQGFRFLKDPLFFASSLFLKKPERIVALTMVMCLSLLVYSIGERKLRQLLQEQGETIHNQVKKPTHRPTLKWIFQLFDDVHLVKIDHPLKKPVYEVKNLRPDGIKVLKILGKNYLEPYLLTK
jgi:transposase